MQERVLITGGRNWSARRVMVDALCTLDADDIICHGAARGADRMAGEIWGNALGGDQVKSYPVNQRIDGPWPGAGPNRNTRMLEDFKPTYALAFPDAESRGTWDMIRKLRAKGLPGEIYFEDGSHQPL